MSDEPDKLGDAIPPAERLFRVKALFERWLEDGLPAGVIIPKAYGKKACKLPTPSDKIALPVSLNQVMVWIAPEFGIHQAIGSKRYVSLKDKEFGKTAKSILDAINKLRKAKTVKRAPPKTEKAKRVAAVGLAKKYMNLLVEVTKQFHEQGEKLSEATRDLAIERNRVELLEDDLAEARKENSALKHMLDRRHGALRVVE